MKKIYFYPNTPVYNHIIYKVIFGSNNAIFCKDKNIADITYFWSGETQVNYSDYLSFNGTCSDISKNFISIVYEHIFGRQLIVNPSEYSGWVVEKSNENATHDGKILSCPILVSQIDPLCTYQVFIDSSISGDNMMEEFRVPIIGDNIPLVYRKLRSVENRFSNVNLKVSILEPEMAFGADELLKILRFSKCLGLDIGEVDVLRSKIDGFIYIVDANRTPNGPPNGMTSSEAELSVARIRKAFEDLINDDNYIFAKKIDIHHPLLHQVQSLDVVTKNKEEKVIEFMPAGISNKFFADKIANSFGKSSLVLAYWFWSGDVVFSLTKRQARKVSNEKRYVINKGSCNLLFDKVQDIFYRNLTNKMNGEIIKEGDWRDRFKTWHFVRKDSFGHVFVGITGESDDSKYGTQYVKAPCSYNNNLLEYQLYLVGDSIILALQKFSDKNLKNKVSMIDLEQLEFNIEPSFMRELDLDIFSCVVQVDLFCNQILLKSYSATFMWPPVGLEKDVVYNAEHQLLQAFKESIMPKIYKEIGIWFDLDKNGDKICLV